MHTHHGKYKNIVLLRLSSPVIENVKHPRHCYPPIALKYIQVLLINKGYLVKLIDAWVKPIFLDRFTSYIISLPVDVIVIYINTFVYEVSLKFINLIKKNKDILIIGIGQDVTAKPERYKLNDSPFDIILPGESECEIVEIIEKLNNGEPKEKIKGYYCLQEELNIPTSPDLNKMPFLIWSKDELREYRFIYPLRVNKKVICSYVISSRGCPYKCIFCSTAVRKSYGEKIILRDASKVVDEIENLTKFGVNVVSFEDDNFAASRGHVISICEEIKKRKLKIKWVSQVRIDGMDYDLLKMMKDAGCVLLLFGVESGSQRIIELLKKTKSDINWKEKANETFNLAKKAGIATCALFIIGNPTETENEVGESIQLAKKLRPDLIKVHFFTPYSGSEAYKQFQNIINIDKELKMYHYGEPLVNVSNMSDKALKQKQREFYKNVLLDSNFILFHLKNYFIFYLYNWKTGIELIWKTFKFLLA